MRSVGDQFVFELVEASKGGVLFGELVFLGVEGLVERVDAIGERKGKQQRFDDGSEE